MLPERFLISVSAFIKLLEAQQGNYSDQAKPNNKQAFFALVGKIHFDKNSVTDLCEASLI